MAVWEFIILICLWVAIGIIVYHLVKIRSMLFDIRTSQCAKPFRETVEKTNYMPFFEIADYDKLKEIMKECLAEENNIEFELKTMIDNNKDVGLIVKDILERYNITLKEKEE